MDTSPRDITGPHRTRRADLTPQNGSAIRDFREQQGYSQEAFATVLGIQQATLSRIEAERTITRTATLNRIAAALGIRVTSVMRGYTPGEAAPAQASVA